MSANKSGFHIQVRSLTATIGILIGLAAGAAGAAQPPDPTSSDLHDNTAGGTGALANLGASVTNDTAFGFDALNANTDGGGNTAIGSWALTANTTGNDNTASGSFALYWNDI